MILKKSHYVRLFVCKDIQVNFGKTFKLYQKFKKMFIFTFQDNKDGSFSFSLNQINNL